MLLALKIDVDTLRGTREGVPNLVILLKKYGADFPPALVARDQLPFALAEFSTHDNQRVTKALNDGLQAALTGTKTAAQAMKDAQGEADRLLRSYK